jgi:long-chain fatty acid transport protein
MTTRQPRACCWNGRHLSITGVLLAIILVVHGSWPGRSLASGFQIFSQSASAAGQGAAFAAQADDPSAIYYNPAGMTQLQGVQFMAGALFVGGSTKYTQAGTNLNSRGDLGGSAASPPPATFYLTATLKGLGEKLNLRPLERMTVGLGVVAPFGLIYRWPEDNTFISTALTRAKLELIDLKPTVAYKVTDTLSVGMGADIYTFFSFWGEGQAEIRFNSSGGPGLPPAGTPIEINGKDTAAGFNLSLLYTPCLTADKKPRCSFGFQYRSRATLHLDGEFRAAGGLVSDARTTLVIPQAFVFGLAYWPVRDDRREWKLEVDLDKTDWSAFKNTDVHLSNGLVIPVARNWEDTLTVMVGTEYKWLDPGLLPHWNVALRGGYWYSENTIPSQTFDPAVPDGNHHTVSVGLGFLCKAGGHFVGFVSCGEESSKAAWYRPTAIGLDLSYQALMYETREISGNTPPLTAGAFVNGTYSTTLHAGMFNVRVNF